MRFEVGESVRVEFTKWDGGRHWEYDGSYLGADEHGDWIGHPAGTPVARPGRSFVDTTTWLTMAPAADRPWVATFNDRPHRVQIYIDLSTPASWDNTTLRSIDMDLDVVLPRDGRDAFIDDEDEFAEHRQLFGYPDDVAARTESAAAELLTAVIARTPPFDDTADRWLARLAELTA